MPKTKKFAEQPGGDSSTAAASSDEILGRAAKEEVILEEAMLDETVVQTRQADDANSDANAGAEEPGSAASNEHDHETLLSTANARADENWDRLARAQAEMDNLRKRHAREIENAHKFALEKIASELLVVRDSLDSSVEAGGAEDADVRELLEGSELILKQLAQVMEKFDIVEVNTAGQKFNPELHQAMSMQEQPDTEPNTVISVLQKGYTLNGRLIRPALVMVSK
jgi:molecular chaperone GrpE